MMNRTDQVSARLLKVAKEALAYFQNNSLDDEWSDLKAAIDEAEGNCPEPGCNTPLDADGLCAFKNFHDGDAE